MVSMHDTFSGVLDVAFFVNRVSSSVQELEWEMDEVECVCANLIHRKCVTGKLPSLVGDHRCLSAHVVLPVVELSI